MSSAQTDEKTYTQEDLDKEIQGKRSVASHLNNTKCYLALEQKKTHQLYNIIMKSNDIDMIEEMLTTTSIQITIRYYAIKSTYINKKGKKTKCWKSVYGNYAGKRKDKIVMDDIPILMGQVYYNSEEFNIVLSGKGNLAEFECNNDCIYINNKRVIEEEAPWFDINYDTEDDYVTEDEEEK
tara:strand:- start:3 stop:545 length:543 start_codon:yes stop_codon:yes gene_type:complete